MAGTLEEALMLAASSESEDDSIVIIDNDLRTVKLPDGFTIGVYNDKDVNDIVVQMPRYYKELDLSPFAISVNFVGADGTPDRYLVTNRSAQSNKIVFHWLVGRNAFLADGTMAFSFCLRKMSGQTVVNEFNTTVVRTDVLEGLETDVTPTPEQQSSIDAAIADMQAAVDAMNDALDEMEENITHYPKITNNYWYVWNASTNSWVNTGVRAIGEVTEQEFQDKFITSAEIPEVLEGE